MPRSADTSRLKRALQPMPEDIAARLRSESLLAAYEARPAYQRNDYLAWIGRARLQDTRERRLVQMLDELRAGNRYMKMAYRVRRAGGPADEKEARDDTPAPASPRAGPSPGHAAEPIALEVKPLVGERWADLEQVFQARGCSVARGCWCMFYRESGTAAQQSVEQKRKSLRELAAQDPAPGLIGYLDGKPVGWVALGPREDYERLRNSQVMKPVDAQPVWSIVCFVVPSAYRRQGVAYALLAGAVAYARERGVTMLEAYPVDLLADPKAESLWFGTRSMFEQEGFSEVARRKPGRPIMRLQLDAPRGGLRRKKA